MSVLEVVTAIATGFCLVYLTWAMLRPEDL